MIDSVRQMHAEDNAKSLGLFMNQNIQLRIFEPDCELIVGKLRDAVFSTGGPVALVVETAVPLPNKAKNVLTIPWHAIRSFRCEKP